MKKIIYSALLIFVIILNNAYAQDEEVIMESLYSKELPMSVNGSGTSWLPESSPMYGKMIHSNGWMLMLHGQAFIRYNAQNYNSTGDKRRGYKWDAPNWFMVMAQKDISEKLLLSFSGMFSLDPLTVGKDGYPLLFQTGESNNGVPNLDRQHPHDLFDELAVGFTQTVTKDVDVNLYVGYPGEPAIGPTAFMHRISAMNNPDAPLAHHWQDATHIVFGVATIGLRYKKIKVEGSVFTGREPDENRYNFDRPLFDSYSGRISFLPTKDLSMQVSYGFIKSPEALEPDQNIHRVTASILHNTNINGNNLATSLVWGFNNNDGQKFSAEHSVLLETNYQMSRLGIYGKYEFVQKLADELEIPNVIEDLAGAYPNRIDINAFTFGANYKVLSEGLLNFSIGSQITSYFTGKRLDPYYGKTPLSAEIYLKISPGSTSHGM